MRYQSLSLFTLLLTFPSFASDFTSAYRKKNISADIYLEEARQHLDEKALWLSALNAAKKYDEATLPSTTKWESEKLLKERFAHIRDERFLNWKKNPDIIRRLTWLFPDDGCFARAALANRELLKIFVPTPDKVFAFGDLLVETENSPSGEVGWWYHVAPIVEVNGVRYVLDPAIEPERALPLKEWLERMGKSEKMKVAICNSGTYFPGSNCEKETDGVELSAEQAEQYYLDLEWERLKRLGRESEI